MTSKLVAVIDHDPDIRLLMQELRNKKKAVDDFVAAKKEECRAFEKAMGPEIDEIWKKTGAILRAKKQLPWTWKFADDLRMTHDEQGIVLVAKDHKEKGCDCPVCSLVKIITGDQP